MNNPKPPIKILVFTQFTSNKILQQFRQDPSITILLMPRGKGAKNGLNLTEAQHVILVESQLHRSVELQAIARFIVDDTAEEVVLVNSRTAQTIPMNNCQTTIVSDHLPTSRATSFFMK